jgi:signal transduction histidine kinase
MSIPLDPFLRRNGLSQALARLIPPRNWGAIFRARPDRVISATRLFLAAGSLLAIWMDPTQPLRFESVAYASLILYTAYALGALVPALRSSAPRVRGAIVRHVVDLSAFAIMMYFTDGPTSPLFVLLGFALLSGALHWGPRGAVTTGIVCVLIIAVLGILDIIDRTDPGLGIEVVATRVMYLIAAALLLVWLGTNQARMRLELWRIAERPASLPHGSDWPMREAVAYLADIFGVRRALIIWCDAEEPWTYLTYWSAGAVREERLPPDRFASAVAERARSIGIVAADVKRGRAVLHVHPGHFEEWSEREGTLIDPRLVEAYNIRSLISAPIRAGDLEARLFLLDVPNAGIDDLSTAEIIAERLQVLFEQERLLKRLRQNVALDERLRIARDLHDGVLQSFAGLALQLRSLDGLVEKEKTELKERLVSIQRQLATEQIELRSFIRSLGPEDEAWGEMSSAMQLKQLVYKLQRQWNIAISLEMQDNGHVLHPHLASDLGWMLSEATANAVRHGGADHINAHIVIQEKDVLFDIADNGRVSDDQESAQTDGALRDGWPRSLCDRAAARGGNATFCIERIGARIQVALPRSVG